MLSEKDFNFVLNVLERTVNIAGFDEPAHLKLIQDQDRALEILLAARENRQHRDLDNQ